MHTRTSRSLHASGHRRAALSYGEYTIRELRKKSGYTYNNDPALMMIVKDEARQTVLSLPFFLAAKQPANARPPLPAALVSRVIARRRRIGATSDGVTRGGKT
jgi:hypothetical protein